MRSGPSNSPVSSPLRPPSVFSRRRFLSVAGRAGLGAGMAAGGAAFSGCIFHHGAKGRPDLDPSAAETQAVNPSTAYFPPLKGDSWEHVTPGQLSWDVGKLAELLDYLGQRNSTGFVVLYKGRIVVENYWQGWDIHKAGVIASAQKSITSLLIGIAQEEGMLHIDDPVSKHLAKGWSKKGGGLSEERILLRQIMTMTSGLDDTGTFEAEPGSKWYYNTPIYYKSKDALVAASKQSLTDFTKSRLWGRIGMNDSSWIPLANADTQHSSSTRDMARFGLLVANKGTWAGTPVLKDPAYLQAALGTSQPLNHAYGYLWWLNGKDSFVLPGKRAAEQRGSLVPSAPDDMVAALGAADKKIYVVPSMDLVVARQGDSAGEAGAAALSTFDALLWQRLMQVVKPS